MAKRCKTCGRRKAATEFRLTAAGTPRGTCRGCAAVAERERRRAAERNGHGQPVAPGPRPAIPEGAGTTESAALMIRARWLAVCEGQIEAAAAGKAGAAQWCADRLREAREEREREALERGPDQATAEQVRALIARLRAEYPEVSRVWLQAELRRRCPDKAPPGLSVADRAAWLRREADEIERRVAAVEAEHRAALGVADRAEFLRGEAFEAERRAAEAEREAALESRGECEQ